MATLWLLMVLNCNGPCMWLQYGPYKTQEACEDAAPALVGSDTQWHCREKTLKVPRGY
jgi:hypothetical protein